MLVHTINPQCQDCALHAAKPHTPARKSTGASGPCKPGHGVVKTPTWTHLSGLFTVIEAVRGGAVPLSAARSGVELSPLPLPAQGLVGCPCTRAGPGCCLTSAHLCPVEKSLHIQSLETCPGSQVVLHASTHTPKESLGTGEPSLRHPQMPASVLLINCVHSPMPHHNPAEQGLHPTSPPVTSSHLQPLAGMWSHTSVHVL